MPNNAVPFSSNNLDTLPVPNPRNEKASKSDFGRVLLIGGSRGMVGAIAMTAGAALYSGSGLIRVATPDCCLETVAGFYPEVMTVPLPNDPSGKLSEGWDNHQFKQHLDWADVVAIGPGLGRSPAIDRLTRDLFEKLEKPLVLDADALNGLAQFDLKATEHHSVADWLRTFEPKAARVLTPHPGEFQRITNINANERSAQVDAAIQLAHQSTAIIVLKGNQTLITNGQENWLNSSGTPAMAVGGAGDVLTGVITSLIGQCHALGFDLMAAVRYAVFVHGRSAELVLNDQGGFSVRPTELLPYIRRLLQNPSLEITSGAN